MTDSHELNRIAQAENLAAHVRKTQQKKDAQSDNNSHVLRIGKRDPATGKYEIIHPGGGITINGSKASNTSIGYGSQVKASSNAGYGVSDSVVTLGNKNRENNPAPTVETKLKKRATPPVIPIKVLFSVIKDNSYVFYIGGDRTEPLEVYRVPSNRHIRTCTLENTGNNLDDWIFSVNYSMAPSALFNYGAIGHSVAKTISPSLSKFNWELDGLPGSLLYSGSGVWVSNGVERPYSVDVNTYNGVIRESTNPARTHAAWQAEYGYEFPLELASSSSMFSHNIGSSIVWDNHLNVFVGRRTVIIAFRDFATGEFSIEGYEDLIRFGVTPYLREDELLTKFDSTHAYITALISIDRKYVLYRRSFAISDNIFQKSFILTQKESEGGQSSQVVTEASLFSDNAVGFIQDPISAWQPGRVTLYHSGEENTTLKAFRIIPANFFTDSFTTVDLDTLNEITILSNGKKSGGVVVYEFQPLGEEFNMVELNEKRIAVKNIKSLGYESDPTLRIRCISYYPEKPFD